MAYRNSTRLQARGYYGKRPFEAFCQNLMADRAWKAALKRGGVVNLERYGDEDRARLSLSYTTFFPVAWNDAANWTVQQGGSQYFVPIPPEGFTGSVGGLSYQNGALNAASIITTRTPYIEENAPLTIRFQIPKPDSGQKGSYWRVGWGAWRFEIRNGQGGVYRLTPAWTSGLEAERQFYLELEEQTPVQSARVAEIEALIYADGKSISVAGSNGWYDGAFEVTFQPDSRGLFSVTIEGEGSANATDIEDTRITKTRKTGVLWPATTVTVSSNGGAYAWQLGRPAYADSGSFSMGVFNALLGLDASDIDVTVRGDANGGAVSGECIERNVAKWEIVLSLTGTGVRTPVVYAAQAFAQGGERDGTDDIKFDTADLATNVIMDMQPTWDEDNRRTSVMVVCRNIDGGIIVNDGSNIFPGYENGTSHGFMHDRLGDPIANGYPIIVKGIITSSTPNQVRTAAANGTGTQYGRPETKNTFNISDWWTLADEILLTRQPVGDGMRLGAYIKQLLLMGGWKTSEVSGVSEDSGITLPVANLGEAPCVQPSYAASLGDFLRSLVEKYAMGWLLTGYTGTWTFAARPTAIKATFTKNAPWAERFEGAAAFRTLNSVDLPRDFTDSYNDFLVLGATDEQGNQLSSRWRIYESFNYPPSPMYIGRVKAYPPVVDEGLRTQSMCDMVVRSLAMTHGRPGRFVEFTSWWVDDIHPKDYVLIDGVTWEITAITGGSTKDDRMTFAAREVI